jgi:hypothetical protein
VKVSNADTIPDEKHYLLDELQSLLEEQIRLTHRGNLPNKHFELLSRKTVLIVEKITQAKILQRPEFENRRKHLQKLYQQLSLIIAAQKADITKRINRVRKVKKTMGVYRNDI